MGKRPDRFIYTPDRILDGAPGWVRAVLAAAEGIFVSLTLLALPAFLIWATSPSASSSGWHSVQMGFAAWSLAHGATVVVSIGSFSMVPLLMTLFTLTTATWSAQRLAATLARDPGPRLSWAGGLRRDVAVSGGIFVGSYTVIGLLVALAARNDGFVVSIPRAIPGYLGVALGALLIGLRTEFRADLPQVAPEWSLRDRAPGWAQAGLHAGLRALLRLVGVGLLLVIAMLLLRFDRVSGLYADLAPGILGGIVLTSMQGFYLPNGAVWAMSWMAGPGFGIGEGSSVTLADSAPGLLPLVPFLSALPEPGPFPAWVRLFVAVPVLLGVALGWDAIRDAGPDLVDRASAAVTGSCVAAVGAGLIGLLASGSLGSARLAHVGVNAALLAAMIGGELLIGAALYLGARALLRPARAVKARSAPRIPGRPRSRGRSGSRPSSRARFARNR